MLLPVPRFARLRSRRHTFAIMAALGHDRLARKRAPRAAAPPAKSPDRTVPPTAMASTSAPASAPTAAPAAATAPATDPLYDLIQPAVALHARPVLSMWRDAAPIEQHLAHGHSRTPWTPTSSIRPTSAAAPPPPPPPLVLFPQRLGEVPAQVQLIRHAPVAPPTARTPPVRSKMPKRVRSPMPLRCSARSCRPRISPARRYGAWATAGRAAVEDSSSTQRACPGGGTPSVEALGGGLACTSTGEVKIRESLADIGGGTQDVQLVARRPRAPTPPRSTATPPPWIPTHWCRSSIPPSPASPRACPCSMAPAFKAGRRESNSFLMSSGLLPPNIALDADFQGG